MEAGLGGRWDATNAKAHEVALLTNVGTDHQDWLGPTRAHIAAEKAAALRGREAIVGEWDPSLAEVIRTHADPQTRISQASQWVTVEPLPTAEASLFPTVRAHAFGEEWQLQLPLAGRFQVHNYRLALAGLGALDQLQLVPRPSRDALIAGTLATRWPGRLEEIRWQGRRFLLDGAHNLEAMTALTQTLAAAGLAGKLDLVFSCLSDKPLAAMAELLRPLVGEVQVTPLPSPRARDLEELARAFPGCRVAASVAEALEAAAPHRLTLVTGSLRLVGEALSFLRGQA
ncbi:MAG: hypothetical protein KatS3mg007_0527 [Thermoanaerobaculum sp.]|nr:MAG: hypothetical protein KatS3mg007_0527 [Thermoanaerobaculum sp.]